MPNSCSMVVAPMKFCVTTWEGSTVKINVAPCLPGGRLLENQVG
jgi:hypothetical protein